MYQPISMRNDESLRLFPTSSRPSQTRALSSYSFSSDNSRISTRSCSTKRATRESSIPSVKEESTISCEAGLIEEKQDSPILADSCPLAKSEKVPFWTRFTIFTGAGRQSLLRKLLSSGPANQKEESSENGIGSGPSSDSKYTGWRAGTLVCCCAVLICIIIEIVLLVWAAKTSVGGGGSGLLYQGKCDRVRSMAVWLLLPLNIAATVLIGTSNYIMQVMAAPDRREINLAHRFAQPIAIGGIRFQDLRSWRGGSRRRAIWWVLAISSLPIHLLLNSAIYSSVQASNSGVMVVSEGFETDPTWDHCNTTLSDSFLSSYFACSLMQSYRAGKTRKLSREQCILQYANGFQTNASSVIVVTSENSKRWYNLPQSVEVPASYGTACQSDINTNWTEVPPSQRTFNFDYVPETGFASVSLPFRTHCVNNTGSQNEFTGQSWSLEPGNANLEAASYSSTNALFFSIGSAMSKVESIRSLFNTFDYRYWATAQMTGDYLNKEYQELLEGWDARTWLCPRADLSREAQCDPSQLLTDATWLITPAAIPVTKCYVLPKEERCALRYSWKILVITLFCDVVKLAATITALRFVTKPLTTLGDVIASFLEDPDPYTKDCCLLDDDAATIWSTSARRMATMTMKRYFTAQGYDWDEGIHEIWRAHGMPVRNTQPSKEERDSYNWMLDGGQWWTISSPSPGGITWVSRSRRWGVVPSRLRWLSFLVL